MREALVRATKEAAHRLRIVPIAILIVTMLVSLVPISAVNDEADGGKVYAELVPGTGTQTMKTYHLMEGTVTKDLVIRYGNIVIRADTVVKTNSASFPSDFAIGIGGGSILQGTLSSPTATPFAIPGQTNTFEFDGTAVSAYVGRTTDEIASSLSDDYFFRGVELTDPTLDGWTYVSESGTDPGQDLSNGLNTRPTDNFGGGDYSFRAGMDLPEGMGNDGVHTQHMGWDFTNGWGTTPIYPNWEVNDRPIGSYTDRVADIYLDYAQIPPITVSAKWSGAGDYIQPYTIAVWTNNSREYVTRFYPDDFTYPLTWIPSWEKTYLAYEGSGYVSFGDWARIDLTNDKYYYVIEKTWRKTGTDEHLPPIITAKNFDGTPGNLDALNINDPVPGIALADGVSAKSGSTERPFDKPSSYGNAPLYNGTVSMTSNGGLTSSTANAIGVFTQGLLATDGEDSLTTPTTRKILVRGPLALEVYYNSTPHGAGDIYQGEWLSPSGNPLVAARKKSVDIVPSTSEAGNYRFETYKNNGLAQTSAAKTNSPSAPTLQSDPINSYNTNSLNASGDSFKSRLIGASTNDLLSNVNPSATPPGFTNAKVVKIDSDHPTVNSVTPQQTLGEADWSKTPTVSASDSGPSGLTADKYYQFVDNGSTAPTVTAATLSNWKTSYTDAYTALVPGKKYDLYVFVQDNATNPSNVYNAISALEVDSGSYKESTTHEADGKGDGLYPGDTIDYKIHWKGLPAFLGDEINSFVITDVIPEGTSLVPDSARFSSSELGDNVSVSGTGVGVAGETITFTLINRSGTAEGDVEFSVKVEDGALGIMGLDAIRNKAHIQMNNVNTGYVNFDTNETVDPLEEKYSWNADDEISGDVKVGDTFTYGINWRVPDDVASASVTITDTLPTGTEFVSATNGTTTGSASAPQPAFNATPGDNGTVTWNLGTQTGGDSGIVFLLVRVTTEAMTIDEITNEAEINIGGTRHDTNITENTISIGKVSEIDERSGAKDGLLTVGDTIDYTIRWKVPDDVIGTVNVRIEDVIPEGTAFVIAGSGGALTSGTVVWEIANKSAGESGEVKLMVVVTKDALDMDVNAITNEASVKIGDNNPVITNETVDDLQEKHTVSDSGAHVGDVKIGDIIPYTIRWEVPGTSAASTVTITDVIPGGTEYVSSDPTGVLTASPDTVTWTLGEQQPGDHGVVELKVKVLPSAVSYNNITNKAEIDINGGKHDTNITENRPPNKVSVTDEADGRNDGLTVGDTIDYEIRWQVPDDAGTVNVVITDKIPTGTKLVASSIYGSGSGIESGGTITWTMTGLDPGATGTVGFTVEVTEEAIELGEIENSAHLNIGGEESDTNITRDALQKKHALIGDVGSYEISGDVAVGQQLVYPIRWEVPEGLNGVSVTITDKIPAGTKFVSMDSNSLPTPDSTISPADPGYDESVGVTWTFDSKNAGDHGVVTLVVEVTPDAVTVDKVTNTGTIAVGNEPEVITNTTENEGPDKTSVASEADHNGDGLEVGDILNYRVRWEVPSGLASYPVDVVIEDTIPAGTEIILPSITEDGVYEGSSDTITWTIEDKAAGDFGFVSFDVRVTNDALTLNEITNEAEITVEGDSPYTTIRTKDKVEDKHGVNEAEVASGEVNVGEELTYYIHWNVDADKYPSGATVVITDEIPAGTEFVSAVDPVSPGTEDGVFDGTDTVTWTLVGTKGAGESGYVKLIVRVTTDALTLDEITNQASVKIGSDSPEVTNTTENAVGGKDSVVHEADGKGDGLTVGDTIDYTIGWSIPGSEPDPLSVIIEDTIPAGTEVVDSSIDITDSFGGTGSYTVEDGKIIWDLGERDPDTYGTVSFSVRVTDEAVPLEYIENTATRKIGDNTYDTNTVRDRLQEKHALSEDGSLAGDLAGGQQIYYHVHWKVPDSVVTTATVTVSDAIPVGTKFVSMDSDIAPDSTDDGSGTGGIVTWVFDDKVAGDEGVVTMVVEVLPEAVRIDKITNEANIDIGGDGHDTNITENKTPEKVSVTDEADDKGDGLTVGDTIYYEVRWEVPSDELSALNVTIEDTIPSGTELVDSSIIGGGGPGESVDFANGKITWDLGSKNPGDIGTVGFTVRVTKDAVALGEVENTATISIGSNTHETNTTIDGLQDKHALTEDYEPSGDVSVGQKLIYQVYWKVPMDKPASDVTITDIIPTGTRFISADSGGIESGGEVTWSLGEKQPGEDGAVTLTVEVTADAVTVDQVTNKAVIKIGDDSKDTNITENKGPNKTSVTHEADGNGDGLDIGDVIDYRVRWEVPVDEAGQVAVTVTDIIPSGTELISGSISEGGTLTGSAVRWNFTDKEAGDFGVVSFKVRVTNAALTIDEIENVASIHVGSHAPVITNTTRDKTEEKHAVNESGQASGDVNVGERITYYIHWSVDAALYSSPAAVILRDTLPAGTKFISADSGGAYSGGTVTWNLGNRNPGTSGTVRLTVEVTPDAADMDRITNKATVSIGGNSHETNVTENKSLSYRITYDANGGAGGPTDSVNHALNEAVNVKFTPAPVRTGYTFLGWSESASATTPTYSQGGTTSFNITADTTLYAVWARNVYTLSYNGNGANIGSVPGSTQHLHGEVATVQGRGNMARGSYTFLGWALAPNAGTPMFYPGNQILMTGDVTLYAVWRYTPAAPPGTGTPEDTPEGGVEEPADDDAGGGNATEGVREEIAGSGVPEEEMDTSQLTLGGIPLVGRAGYNWALLNLILALLGLAAAVVAVVRGLRRREDDEEGRGSGTYSEGDDRDERKPRRIWAIVAAVSALLGVILFILTEDMSLPMAWVDKWTIFNAALFILSLAGAILASKKSESDEQARGEA
jgi:fimbrial isopeptide formation D2 family protein/uncharacterized repeat protein (TIGR01451 family)/uncharacterized repeat protein (TIGR02543 family)